MTDAERGAPLVDDGRQLAHQVPRALDAQDGLGPLDGGRHDLDPSLGDQDDEAGGVTLQEQRGTPPVGAAAPGRQQRFSIRTG
jgi:hypothetical protein